MRRGGGAVDALQRPDRKLVQRSIGTPAAVDVAVGESEETTDRFEVDRRELAVRLSTYTQVSMHVVVRT